MEQEVLQTTINNTPEPTDGVKMAPIFTNILPGNSYLLTVTNNTDKQARVKIEAAVFEVLGSEKRIYPNGMSQINDQPLSDFITSEKTELSLTPGSSESFRVNYIKAAEGYLLGVMVKSGGEKTETATSLSSSISGASVIIKTEVGEAELVKINTRLEVVPEHGISILGQKLSLTNNYTARTIIENDSDVILKPGGIVILYTNNKRITAEQLTTSMLQGLYPGEKFSTDKKLTDEREFWKSMGTAEVKQELHLNNNELINTENIYVFPYQLLIALVAVVCATMVISLVMWKRKTLFRKKPAAKVKYKHEHSKHR